MSERAGSNGEAQPVLLVVDDEPLNRDLLRRVLFHDFDILEAEDAEAALKILEAGDPVDIIICDQLMPGKTGTELCAEVRTRWPKIVSLLLTGYDEATDVLAAKKAGVIFDVISKPWIAPQLRELLDRALKRA